MTARLLAGVATSVVVVVLASGCGSTGTSHDSDKGSEEALGAAADTTTCVADAKPVKSLPTGFPRSFPFPKGAVVYHAEDRGKDGVIVSAIASAPIKEVLGALNGPAQKAGFKVTDGETEKHDAEANWTGNGFRGRWAIKESATCKDEVSIQVLASRS